MLKLFALSALLSVPAFAQEAAQTAAAPDPVKGLLVNLPIFLALFGLFYFGIVRPQKQQQKKQVEFVSSLGKGDEVVTQSGIIGTIRGLTDRVATLEVSPDTEIKVLRSQIQARLKDILNG